MPPSGRNEQDSPLHPQYHQPPMEHTHPTTNSERPIAFGRIGSSASGGAVTLARELHERRARSRSNSPPTAGQKPS